MGCIMTPMPNYLSTYLSLPFNHKTTHKRVEEKKSGAVWKKEKSGKGRERETDGLYHNTN